MMTGSDDQDDTVTIALDLDKNLIIAPLTNDPPLLHPSLLNIGTPLRPSEICPRVPEHALICHLPSSITHLLERKLNPPSLGTMRNWEYVAAHLGVSIDEIANWRRRDNPMSAVINRFGNVQLKRFLEILCNSNRMDVLLSIERPLHHIHNSLTPTATTTTTFDHTQLTSTNYILILHHELKTSKELRAMYRMLVHNLKESAPKSLKLLDIDKCVDETNLNSSIQRIYDSAHQILLVPSVDYSQCVVKNQATDSPLTRIKCYIHSQMNNEYIRNGMRNLRFRVVLMEGTARSEIPNGFASNTICYEFPAHFSELCVRLFSNAINNETM